MNNTDTIFILKNCKHSIKTDVVDYFLSNVVVRIYSCKQKRHIKHNENRNRRVFPIIRYSINFLLDSLGLMYFLCQDFYIEL